MAGHSPLVASIRQIAAAKRFLKNLRKRHERPLTADEVSKLNETIEHLHEAHKVVSNLHGDLLRTALKSHA